jgi:Coenzyme PQQ synthesis protein D (PqqD)
VTGAGTTGAIAPETRCRRAADVLERRTGESVVLLAAEPPIVLRGTGVAIWDAFATTRRVADVVDDLAATYDATPATIERELLTLLAMLQQASVIEIVRTAP